MARSEQKRQKKHLKKKRRTNDLRKIRNQTLNMSSRDFMLANNRGEWEGCYLSGTKGMYQVAAIRNSRNGPIAAFFLVDSYCLGIKDTFFLKDVDLENLREQLSARDAKKIEPAHGLAFVSHAIDYARNIGFEPHRDTELCSLIFNGVEASAFDLSSVENPIEFGRNGKPCYINGPRDSIEFRNRILKTLSLLGEGKFDSVLIGNDENNIDLRDGYESDEATYENEYQAEYGEDLDDGHLDEDLADDAMTVEADSVHEVH